MKETKPLQTASLVAVWALSLVITAGAYAQPISPGGALFIDSSPIYRIDPPAPNPVWDVNSVLNSGSIKNASGVGNLWQIRPQEATIVWNNNALIADTSAGGLAQASFGGGGLLQITGKLKTVVSFPQTPALVFDGLLLEAVVSGFDLRETDVNSNVINSINQTIKFTPTGGFLFTNGTLRLDGLYEFAIVGAVTGPLVGGPLNDFSLDLASLQAFQINFNLVPEPTSLLLVGCGAILLACPRRRAAR